MRFWVIVVMIAWRLGCMVSGRGLEGKWGHTERDDAWGFVCTALVGVIEKREHLTYFTSCGHGVDTIHHAARPRVSSREAEC